MTQDPNEGDVVVAFLDCRYKRVDTCRERVGGVRFGKSDIEESESVTIMM